jgi:hypothetical protein
MVGLAIGNPSQFQEVGKNPVGAGLKPAPTKTLLTAKISGEK